jgi:hypothetical protein
MDKDAAPPPYPDWTELLHRFIDLLLPSADDIFSSPSKLGELLTICAQLAAVEPHVREIATELALQQKQILGWTLVRHEGNRYVEAAHVRELLLGCRASQLPALLEAIAKALGSVSEAKWRTPCEVSGRLDAEIAISQCGTTAFLRSNPQPKS